MTFRRSRVRARRPMLALAFLGAAAGSGCGDDPTEYAFDLPPGFPEPRVPDDNPMSNVKVELGRRLFYDVRLSRNETQSCGSCHLQELAFTDGLATAIGSTGEIHPRGSMSLANVAYSPNFTWANPVLDTPESQVPGPIFGEFPIVELGMAGQQDLLLERLRGDQAYARMFPDAFPGAEDDGVSVENVVKAIAAFERTLISGDAPYDRFVAGDEDAITASAQRGLSLFFSERLECFHCHGGFNLSSAVDHSGLVEGTALFANNGLYNVDGRGAYPAENQGLFEFTDDPRDQGRFKPPTLRNIAVTAPYMHDGSIPTLDAVLDHYAAGGRNVTEGPNIGDGRDSPVKSAFVSGFELTEQEREDVLAFLESLTDEAFLTDPRFSNPFE